MIDFEQTLKGKKIIPEQDRTLSTSQAWDRPTRIQILFWVVISVFMIGISLSNFLGYQVGSRFDEDRYLILARSLVSAERYGMVNSPGEPVPERFPFGYPLLVSPIVWLFPDNLDAPKALSLVATVLNAALLFWGWPWFARGRSYWWGVAIAGLYALSPLTIDFSRRIMSESVFLTFSLISILLAEKYVRGSSNRWIVPGLAAALTFVVFTRTIGIVLLACILLYILLLYQRTAWRAILQIALFMALLVSVIVTVTPVRPVDLLPFWYLQNDKNAQPLVNVVSSESESFGAAMEPTGEASFEPDNSPWKLRWSNLQRLALAGFRHVFGENLRWITVPFGMGVVRQVGDLGAGDPSLIVQIYRYLISGLVVFGFGRLIAQERFSLFAFYPVFYAGALFFWNFNSPRLFYPVQPQIQFAWLMAIEALVVWTARVLKDSDISVRMVPIALTSLIMLMFAGSIFNSLQIQNSQVHAGDLRIRSVWVKTHTGTSAILMTEKPEVDYLYSGRKTVPYPDKLDSDQGLESYLLDNNIDYILVGPRLGWFDRYSPEYSDRMNDFLPAFERLSQRDRIRLVYSLDSDLIRVYQVQNISGEP